MAKISEAIKTIKGAEQEIIGVGRNDLPEFFKEMDFKVGVEIGVAKGQYSEILAKDGLKIYGVDPYLDYDDYHTRDNQARLDGEMSEAIERLKPYDWTLIRKTSMEAVKDFEDDSLDFVYIDGHHALKFVVEDIFEWSKKVKKGGVISGHDFVRTTIKKHPFVCHVKQGVRAYADAYGIADWYVLGRHHFPEDKAETRDRWRSWLFIRK